MKKFVILFFSAVAILGLVSFAISSSSTPPKGKITITMTGKKPATFDHSAHVKRTDGDCQECHHNDPPKQGSKCTECHTKEGKDDAPAGKDVFHKKACKTCHAKEKPDKKFGCKVCH